MKLLKTLLLSIGITLLLTSFFEAEPNDLIGTWEGTDKGEVGKVVFEENGYAGFEINGRYMGGEDVVVDGKTGSMRYEILSFKDTVKLYIIVELDSVDAVKRMGCLAHFHSRDSMTLASSFSPLIPDEFTKENSINLHRIHPK